MNTLRLLRGETLKSALLKAEAGNIDDVAIQKTLARFAGDAKHDLDQFTGVAAARSKASPHEYLFPWACRALAANCKAGLGACQTDSFYFSFVCAPSPASVSN
jgi:hypothetical protein